MAIHFSLISHERNSIPIFAQILKNEALISKAPIVLFDGNLTVDAMGTILEICKKYDKPGECLMVSRNTNSRKILILFDFI